MYTEQEYLYGWLFYLLGVMIIIGCGWWLTRKLRPPFLRHGLRLLVTVALLTPWHAAPDLPYLAPAWIIAAFEGLFDGEFWRAGSPLLVAVGGSLTLYLVLYGVLSRRAKRD